MRFRDLKKQTHKNHQKKDDNKSIKYASHIDRIKAFITDIFMIYIPILYIVTYVVLDGKDDFQASYIAQFSGVALYAFVYAIFLSKLGQTPGKKAYTIKVVDSTTFEKISFFRALLRFVSFLFSATIGIGLLFPFYRKDKKALHDLIARTCVIVD